MTFGGDAGLDRRTLLRLAGVGALGSAADAATANADDGPANERDGRSDGRVDDPRTRGTDTPYELAWTRELTPGDSGSGSGFALTPFESRRRFAVTGWTDQLGRVSDDGTPVAADVDAFVARLSASGDDFERSLLSDGAAEVAGGIAPHPDGGFLVQFAGFDGGDRTLGALATDPAGNLRWRRVFDTYEAATAGDVLRDPDGDYLLAARIWPSSGDGSSYGRLLQVGPDGTTGRSWQLGSGLSAIEPITADRVLVMGQGTATDPRPGLAALVRDGSVTWQQTFLTAGGSTFVPRAAATTADREILVVGNDGQFGEGPMTVVRLGPGGEHRDTHTFTTDLAAADGAGATAAHIDRVAPDRFLLAGTVHTTPWRPWLLVVDAAGSVVWSASPRYERERDVVVTDVAQMAAGGYVASGTVFDAANDDDDYEETETGGAWAGRFRPANQRPRAAFDVSASSPTVGSPVRFDASASEDPDGTLRRFEWDFDDDGSVDTTGEVVSHTFRSAGDRTVVLQVTDDAGATDTALRDVSVLSELTADDLSIRIENNFVEAQPDGVLDSLYGAATSALTPPGAGTDPNKNEAYIDVDVSVTVPNADERGVESVSLVLESEEWRYDTREEGKRGVMNRTDEDTYVFEPLTVSTPTQVGLMAFKGVMMALSLRGVNTGEAGSVVHARTSAYPDVTLAGVHLTYDDGTSTTVSVDRELPRYTDVCPGNSLGSLALSSYPDPTCDLEDYTPTDLQNAKSVGTFSPASPLVVDGDGNRVGRAPDGDGFRTVNEIEGAVYSGPLHHEFVVVPGDRDYDVAFHGTDDGTASFVFESADDGEIERWRYDDVAVEPGATATTGFEDTTLDVELAGGDQRELSATAGPVSVDPVELLAATVEHSEPGPAMVADPATPAGGGAVGAVTTVRDALPLDGVGIGVGVGGLGLLAGGYATYRRLAGGRSDTGSPPAAEAGDRQTGGSDDRPVEGGDQAPPTDGDERRAGTVPSGDATDRAPPTGDPGESRAGSGHADESAITEGAGDPPERTPADDPRDGVDRGGAVDGRCPDCGFVPERDTPYCPACGADR